MAKHYKKKEIGSIGDFFINIILIGFIILLIVSSIEIFKWYKNSKANKQVKNEVSEAIKVVKSQEEKEEYEVDFKKLKEKNTDAVAWLKVNGVDIEFPIVKTTNNGFYLSRNFNKEYNLGGWIFADYRNKFDGTDKNIIIYGHNMRDGSMFGKLKNILKSEWQENKENHKLIFITEKEKMEYEVFSVYQIEEEDYYIKTIFTNNAEFKAFADTLQERSLKDFGVKIGEDDEILTLSTCANNNKYRVVLHAKKVK